MKTTFPRLLGYALVHQATVIRAFLLLLIATGAGVSGPYLIKVFIDDYLTVGLWNSTAIAGLAAGYLVVQLVATVTSYRQALAFHGIAIEVVQQLRGQVFSHALSLPIAYFDRNATGALISRITNDTEAIKNLYVNVISFFAQSIVRMMGVLIAMAILDIRLMWICALSIPVAVIMMAVYRRISTPIFQRARGLLGDINRKLNESIDGMSVVQLLNQQRCFQEDFRKTSADYASTSVKEVTINGFLLYPLVHGIHMLLLAGLLFGFGLSELSAAGAVRIGVVYAFVNYLSQLVQPLAEMTSRLNMAQQALVAAGRVFELLDEDTGRQTESMRVPDNHRLTIDIRRFGYDDKKDALRDIRFDIEEGAFIGIVGHTGSGKSTLMSLLMDFYPMGQGEIRMGGVPIPQIPKGAYTRLIGFVQQDPFLFAGTVADNIRLELPLDRTAVIEAARQAQLHQVVVGLPDGYDTMLTEQGKNLSAGERQLLGLARTLIRKPKILLLDEATANIDSHTEELIRQSLTALRGKVTLIAIAHRLGTVRDADRLYVLHQGHVQQSGTHEGLMGQAGLYRHMYRLLEREDPYEIPAQAQQSEPPGQPLLRTDLYENLYEHIYELSRQEDPFLYD
uniref:ATP-binding cassette, subfamily B, multidrug efflux pump n=1 Tax=Candidatus Kentrum sp. TUN TaxID=2126343 RepID=A0A450ZCK7_9GAMM|nr:MAG: ATP-binding cassette, subfamily B, multidrug efflux pump [Candidatus Kentron sp. TUN]VFK54848.1 MAG: ATP-binding cassette, subfamily B, multidrug efflux pump [Candidatus Kentron sp. TUN]VFK60053.1 MAG: ATP-binding cassette, subfamily B, multidrug efflux pump [Candidatus Kentron sp. TUN]